MTNWKIIDNAKLSKRAQHYFGGDVQRFEIIRKSNGNFYIRQTPHWGNPKWAAFWGGDQREAIRAFNDMARADDCEFA